ncbi:hypothetical protein M1247_32750 [Mycobacterium sp. 21AC1]|uniref:rhomboid-like protein n=1 Tax=[Mycobacterium] appelbergii TaxID=2939269 RepID=UPI00293933D1|nr:rhomboid-like protein [Mycobacterium sp. 21AC1]MDV3129714.1 hypothetical protein [Mycobacterium sp. 21AC1]
MLPRGVSAVLISVARIRVTLCYAAVLTAVTTALSRLDPSVSDRIAAAASTNLHNLRHGHFGTLLASAFVTESDGVYAWLPGLVCLLALAELLWRSRPLVLTFTVGHIGATLLVAAGLAVEVKLGWVPASVGRDIDVGMSYGAAAVLGALTAAIPLRRLPAWVGWWLAAGLTAAALSRDFTATGHLIALLLGMVVSTRLNRPDRLPRGYVALLAVAALFGLMLFAGSGPMMPVMLGVGALGAVAGVAAGKRIRSATNPSLMIAGWFAREEKQVPAREEKQAPAREEDRRALSSPVISPKKP